MSGLGRTALLGSLATAAGAMGGFLGRFAVNIALARILTPVEFGEFALAMLQAEFLGLIVAFSFPQALLQLEDDYEHLAGTVFWMSFALAAALFAAALAVTPFIAAEHGPTVGACFLWMAAARLTTSCADTFMSLQQRRYRFQSAAALQLSGVIIGSLAALGLALVDPSPFALVVRDAAPSVVVTVVLGALLFRREGRALFRFDRRSARAVWSLGRSLFLNRVFEVVQGRVDQLVVGLALGTRELGFYQQARYLLQLPQATVAPIAGVVGLRTMSGLRDDPRRQARVFELTQFAVTRLILIFAIGAAVAGDLAVRVVLGPGWAPTGEVVMLFSPWLVPWSLAANYKVMLIAERRFAPILWATGLAAAALAAVAIPLATWVGIDGLIAANLIVVAGYLAIMMRATPRHLVVAGWVYVPTAVAAAVATAVGWGVRAAAADLAAWWPQSLALVAAFGAFGLASLLLEGRRLRTELRYVVTTLRGRPAG